MECVVQRNCIGNVRKQAHKRCWAPLVDARLGGRQMETNDEVFLAITRVVVVPAAAVALQNGAQLAIVASGG